MSDLFTDQATPRPVREPSNQPLAARMRPRDLTEVRGQEHILAEGKLLLRAIESDRFSSLIFLSLIHI